MMSLLYCINNLTHALVPTTHVVLDNTIIVVLPVVTSLTTTIAYYLYSVHTCTELVLRNWPFIKSRNIITGDYAYQWLAYLIVQFILAN